MGEGYSKSKQVGEGGREIEQEQTSGGRVGEGYSKQVGGGER